MASPVELSLGKRGTSVPVSEDDPVPIIQPLDLMTDGGDGPNRRLRVDVGQTGFFAGREFRTYYEFTTDTVFKIVVPINTILWFLGINLLSGEVRLETVAGGTEGGTFSTVLPIFGRNNMSERPEPFYTPQVVISAGGTHTGGTILDVLRNKTSDNSNFAGAVGVNSSDERGVAAATYYFRLTVTGTTSGTLKVNWEERP
jgi:hypothetical protein